MMPNVPIVGWDVAFTPGGVYLLEVQYVQHISLLFWNMYLDNYMLSAPYSDVPFTCLIV